MMHCRDEYPLFYFMGANYAQTIKGNNKYALFNSPEFRSRLNLITQDIFTEDDCDEIDKYLRQYYGRYVVKDNVYSWFKEIDEQWIPCEITFDRPQLIATFEELEMKNISIKSDGKTIYENLRSEFFTFREPLTPEVARYWFVYLDVSTRTTIMYDTLSYSDLIDYIEGLERGSAIAISYGLARIGDFVWFTATETGEVMKHERADSSTLQEVYSASAIVEIEQPDRVTTIKNMQSIILNLAYFHKDEWKALKQIAQAYYDKISNGDIINNYSITEQRSGTDSIDDERNLKDISTPNITRSRISTSDRTTTPNTTVESTDINSRVGNVVNDGFHDQSKVNSTTTNTGTTTDNLIADSEDTTSGSETTDRTGTTNREITHGRKVETKGIRDVNQLREYMRLWESTRLEWLLAVIHEIVPKFLYMTYEI